MKTRTIMLGILTVLALGTAKAATINVILEGKKFIPHQAIARVGDTVQICSNDTIFHHVFSISRHNEFGGTKGIEPKNGDCTSVTVKNPTSTCIQFAIFDYIHSFEKLALMVPRQGGGEGECVKGSWEIVQTAGNGTKYAGNLILDGSGTTLSGTAAWANHQQGRIRGTVNGFTVRFSIDYGDGLVGTYSAMLSDKMDQMLSGSAASNKGGGSVAWQATRK